MANPSDTKEFLEMVVKEFGEVLVHNLVFRNNKDAVAFFSTLSFVKQTQNGPSMPSHIKAFMLELSDGAFLSIAGKFQVDESVEIRKKCMSTGIEDEFFAIGKSQAAVAQTVNERLGIGAGDGSI